MIGKELFGAAVLAPAIWRWAVLAPSCLSAWLLSRTRPCIYNYVFSILARVFLKKQQTVCICICLEIRLGVCTQFETCKKLLQQGLSNWATLLRDSVAKMFLRPLKRIRFHDSWFVTSCTATSWVERLLLPLDS